MKKVQVIFSGGSFWLWERQLSKYTIKRKKGFAGNKRTSDKNVGTLKRARTGDEIDHLFFKDLKNNILQAHLCREKNSRTFSGRIHTSSEKTSPNALKSKNNSCQYQITHTPLKSQMDHPLH